MENENVQTAVAENEEQKQINIFENFNYIGKKETVAYILNDVSNTFHIGYGDSYIWDVVHVDFTVSAVVNIFTSAWDIINDLLLATIVDNTRTRIGKFRPYLLGLQIPLTLLGMLYWMIPVFFPNTSGTFIPAHLSEQTAACVRKVRKAFSRFRAFPRWGRRRRHRSHRRRGSGRPDPSAGSVSSRP